MISIFRFVVLTFILSGGFASSTARAGFEEGKTAYLSGDHATALREWKPLALLGHAESQFLLGVMSLKGWAVPQSSSDAAKWFKKAVASGFPGAQANLGILYEHGDGVSQDHARAADLYRLAAEQGHTTGQFNLGLLYAKGAGLPKDNVQAHKWMHLASLTTRSPKFRDYAVKSRDVVSRGLTGPQLTKAQNLARDWMIKFQARRETGKE